MATDSENSRAPLSWWLKNERIGVDADILELFHKLDALGFQFKSMAEDGSYFVCLSPKRLERKKVIISLENLWGASQ